MARNSIFRWGDSKEEKQDLYSETLFSLKNHARISEKQALKIPAVKAAIELISNSIATLPIYLYESEESHTLQKIVDDEREILLNINPNYFESAHSLKKKAVQDYLLFGKAYLLKRNGQLHYLEANHIKQEDYTEDGITISSRKFIYSGINEVEIFEEELLIIDSGTNGLLYDSADIFEIALSQQEVNSSILRTGALPSGILKANSRLTEKAIARLRESWQNLYSGPNRAGKTIILEEGLEYQKLQLSLDELQMTDSQKNTLSDIARVFNLPEAMINSSANKYDSLSQNNTQFLQHTLSPIITSFEASFNNSLLDEEEKYSGHKFKFDTSEILRLTEAEKIEVVSSAFKTGLYSYNQSMKKLDLPKVEKDFRSFSIGSVQVFDSGEMNYLNLGPMGEKNEGGNQN